MGLRKKRFSLPIGFILVLMLAIFYVSIPIQAGQKVDSGSNVNVPALTEDPSPDGATDFVLTYDDSDASNKKVLLDNLPGGGGGGAPTDADYLVGTANGSLSAEIVVGTTPGGELGGTWGTPTVDSGIHDDEYVQLGDTFAGDVTGTYDATVVGDNSHSHDSTTLTMGEISELSDVTSKTGTGTVVVMQGSPSLTTPTIASLTNAQHDHADAAGGGNLDSTAITAGSISSTNIKDGEIVNADINASAAIDVSKTALVAGTNITLATNTLNLDSDVVTNSFSSDAADPADAGVVRLSNTENIAWRNAANDGNVTLSVDGSNITQVSGALNAGGAITGSNLSGTNTGDDTDGDNMVFDDDDSKFSATNLDDAISELDDVNGSGPNASDGKVNWEQLIDVPAGFADGTDDGGGSPAFSDIATGTNTSATMTFGTGSKLFITEKASNGSPGAGIGEIWSKTGTPNQLYFTDDAGNDLRLDHVYKDSIGGEADPVPSNDGSQGYEPGSIWVNDATGIVWGCVDSSAGLAVWKELNDATYLDKADGTANPTTTNDGFEGYEPGSIWINTTSGQTFGCIDSATSAAKWVALNEMPIVDTGAIAKGSADATRQVRFEVDSVTSGNTRVLTVPDRNVNLRPYLIVPYVAIAGEYTYTAPSSEEFFGNQNTANRAKLVNLSNFTEVRMSTIIGSDNGFAGANLYLKYHTSFTVTIGTYSDIGTSPVIIDLDAGTNTSENSGWIPLAAGAIADDVYIVMTSDGGNGADTVILGSILIEFR